MTSPNWVCAVQRVTALYAERTIASPSVRLSHG